MVNNLVLQFDLWGSAWLQVFLSILSPLHLKYVKHSLIGLMTLAALKA